MPDITPELLIKAGAVATALAAAYGAKGDGFRRLLAKFTTAANRERTDAANKDAAWRELMDDSRARNCKTSIDLLNQWQASRTLDGITDKGA